MKYFDINLVTIYNYDDIKGAELVGIHINKTSTALAMIEMYRSENVWKLANWDLTFYRGFATIIDVAVNKLIDYFIWKTLQF